MGQAKRQMEHQDHLEGVAAEILVRAKVWKRCRNPGCGDLIDDGGGDVTEAYMLGNAMISRKDPLVEDFESRREMTDTVKVVYESGLAVDCRSCSCQRIWRDNM